MNQTRLQKLTQKILDHGLDGMALMPGPNMLYISGIHAHVSERPILLFIPAGAKHTVRNVGRTESRWLYGYRR